MKLCVEKLIKKSFKKKRGVEPQTRATTTTTIQDLNTFGDCHPAKPLGKILQIARLRAGHGK